MRAGSYEAAPRRFYEERGRARGTRWSMARTGDIWVMNAISIGFGLGALAFFIIGMVVGTGVTSGTHTTASNFEHGSIWLLGSIALAVFGYVFRREEHIVDPQAIEELEEER